MNGDYDCDVLIQSTDMIEHDDSWGMEHYISSNYESWGLDDDDEWLLAMKSQYSEPTADERQNAIKLN